MTPTHRTDRRAEALSRDLIVAAAIEILDAGGEQALTFRALATRLATGAGAIYWHVADKDALLAATAEAVVDPAVSEVGAKAGLGADPRAAIRGLALGLFDAIDAHPWVGAQLVRAPWQSAMVRIFEGIGRQLQALGVPERAQFDAASALLSLILGVAGQNAAAARLDVKDRSAFLAAVADAWMSREAADFPFVHQVAAQLRDHDDRDQFLAGIDLILAGIATLG